MNSYSIFMVNEHIQVLLDEAAAHRMYHVEKRGLFSGSPPLHPRSRRPSTAPPTTASRSSRRSTTIRTGAEASSPRFRPTSLQYANDPWFLPQGLSCVCAPGGQSRSPRRRRISFWISASRRAVVDAVDRPPVRDEPDPPAERREGGPGHAAGPSVVNQMTHRRPFTSR